MQKPTTAGETAIQKFNSEQFGVIRTAGTPENPLFCLTDICKALGLQAAAVARRLNGDVISSHTVTDSKGRKNRLNFVNEDGLYDVILDSRKPEAPKAPSCDNCTSMEIRQTRDGANQRYCEIHGQWIPDNEHQPVCDLHRAFSLTLTPIARKGGAQ